MRGARSLTAASAAVPAPAGSAAALSSGTARILSALRAAATGTASAAWIRAIRIAAARPAGRSGQRLAGSSDLLLALHAGSRRGIRLGHREAL